MEAIRFICEYNYSYCFNKALNFENKSSKHNILFKEPFKKKFRLSKKNPYMEGPIEYICTSFCHLNLPQQQHRSWKKRVLTEKELFAQTLASVELLKEESLNKRTNYSNNSTSELQIPQPNLKRVRTNALSSRENSRVQFAMPGSESRDSSQRISDRQSSRMNLEMRSSKRHSSRTGKISGQTLPKIFEEQSSNSSDDKMENFPEVEKKSSDPIHCELNNPMKIEENVGKKRTELRRKPPKSDPARIRKRQKYSNSRFEMFKEFMNQPEQIEEQKLLKMKFPSKECLSKKKKFLKKKIVGTTDETFTNLKLFWQNFGAGKDCTQKNIRNLDWKAKAIFEAFLIRKDYCENVEWTAEFINRIKNRAQVKRSEENVKYILKMCYRILMKDYKKSHYSYSMTNKKFLDQYPREKKELYGFLHSFFWDTKQKLGNNLEDFIIKDAKLKDNKRLNDFLKLIFTSGDFTRRIEGLTDLSAFENGKGIFFEFKNQLNRKIKSKCQNFQDIFNYVAPNDVDTSFFWTKNICNDLLFNPKCKFPWTFVDMKRALKEFNELREYV